jgi:hypothetical protein
VVTEQTFRPVIDPEARAEVTDRLHGIQRAITALTAELHDAMRSLEQCDGERDGEPCILPYHSGLHRSETGHEWLDS